MKKMKIKSDNHFTLDVFIIFSSLLALLNPSFAAPAEPAPGSYQAQSPNEKPACILRPKDPNDLGWTMPAGEFPLGKYRGQCIDTTIKRPAKILVDDSEEIFFANFLYQGKWWIAKLPKSAVEETIFHIVKFKTGIPGVTAAHTEIRFKLKPTAPLELTTQEPGIRPRKAQVRDLILSFEYAAPRGVGYNILGGEINEYAMVPRVVSTLDRAHEELADPSEDAHQYRLKIPNEKADRILQDGIRESDQIGLETMYNTLNHNCTTTLFDLIDAGMEPYQRQVSRFETPLSMDPIAGPALRALKQRLLIDDRSEIETVAEEFGEPSSHCLNH